MNERILLLAQLQAAENEIAALSKQHSLSNAREDAADARYKKECEMEAQIRARIQLELDQAWVRKKFASNELVRSL